VKEVHLFNGNLVLDCPTPKRILNKVNHAEPPEQDDFTHVRYSALTCHLSEFKAMRFALCPRLLGKPRSTKVLVAISVSENDLNSPAKRASFART
jgi:chitin synthase